MFFNYFKSFCRLEKNSLSLSKKPFGGWKRQRIFFKTSILFFFRMKINKIDVLKNFILQPQATEYFSDSL